MYFTVFTPTYNRAYILGEAYKSLTSQTCKDFMWLIMDDGSIDETESLVNSWIEENSISIKYLKQSNQGRFAAYNNALCHAEGELFVFLDSDDRLQPEALEKWRILWENIDTRCFSGIISYMAHFDGKIIGNQFPDNISAERMYTLYDKYRLTGDKAIVFRMDIIKNYKYTIYEGEKFIGDSTLFNEINKKLPMYICREALYLREYPEDGMTKNLAKYQINSPNGMAFYYRQTLELYRYNKKTIIKHAIGYVAFARLAHWDKIIINSHRKILTILLYIPGLIYFFGLKIKYIGV